MPYTDPDKHREWVREKYRKQYNSDPAYAEKERERQRKLYEANREKIIARVIARRKALQAAKRKVKK